MENITGDNCILFKPPFGRLVLVGLFGSVVALVSALQNLLLFVVWVRHQQRRKSHFLYLIWLAFLDTWISLSYILLMSLSVLMDYYEVEWIAKQWYKLMTPVLAISHITMTSSGFFIAVASYERFLITSSSKLLPLVRNNRPKICILVLIFGLLFKGPVYFEITIVPNGNCTGMTAYHVAYSELSNIQLYNTVFRFWIRSIGTIFLPFTICLYNNIRIVATLKHKHRSARLFHYGDDRIKVNYRSATRMLVLVGSTYLLAKSLNVIITAWEFIDPASLEELNTFYSYSSDVISFLTVFACATRLPIYIACSAEVRQDIRRSFKCGSNVRVEELTPDECNGLLPAPRSRADTAGTHVEKFVVALAMGAVTPQRSPSFTPNCNGSTETPEYEYRFLCDEGTLV